MSSVITRSGAASGVAASRSRTDAESLGFGRRFVSAVSFGSLLNPVNSSIIAIALVAIGQSFSVGAGATAWLVAVLYLATAIGQPTMGRLADRLGPRRVYLAGIGAGGRRWPDRLGRAGPGHVGGLARDHRAGHVRGVSGGDGPGTPPVRAAQPADARAGAGGLAIMGQVSMAVARCSAAG